MGAGLLFALTLPGLVILLVVLAAVEQLWSRLGRRSVVFRRHRHALAAGSLDVFSAALAPGRQVDLEEQRVREVRRDDVQDGAPPYGPIDLDSGTVHLDVRGQRATQASPSRHRGPLASGSTADGGGAMSTSTEERTTWVCDNCATETAAARKRCAECGTSRF